MKEAILALTAEVQETKGAVASAAKLLGDMNAKLKEIYSSGDLEALKALTEELDAQNASLAQAVADNAMPEEPADADAPTAGA